MNNLKIETIRKLKEIFILKIDKKYKPCIYIICEKLNDFYLTDDNYKFFINYIIKFIKEVIKIDKKLIFKKKKINSNINIEINNYNIFIILNNFKIRKMNFKLYKKLSYKCQELFPDRLNICYLVNCNKILNFIIKIFLTFLDEKTKSRIKIISK